MSCKVKELNLNGIIYNTSIEADRRIIGKYYELKLLKYFNNNNIEVEYISNDNIFSSYDFIITYNNIKYIVELKSRLNDINNHNFELISSNKIKAFKKLINKNKDVIKILFVFNHIITEDNFKFYYYIVNTDEIENIAFLNYDCYDKPTYELPIKHLKPLEQLLKN